MNEDIPDYKKPVCAGYGVIRPKYMFVGISGGRLGCIQTGIPFTRDMSGRLFQRVLGKLGYSKSDEFSENPELVNCYMTNLVKGKILTTTGCNRAPTNEEIRYWLDDFYEECWRITPQKIVAVGSIVYDYLKDEGFPAKVLKVKHPSWYGRHGALDENNIFWKDMYNDYLEVLGKND